MGGFVVTQQLGFADQGLVEIPPPRSIGSPLRYPGGKSRQARTIRQHVPVGIDSIVSPFFGGGWVELECAAVGMRVHGADNFEPLVNFWRQVLTLPVDVAARVRLFYPLSKFQFKELQQRLRAERGADDDLWRAAIFFTLNRTSFSGTTLSGGFAPGHDRFTLRHIEALENFSAPGIEVVCADWLATMTDHADKFAYLDPPYMIGRNLYGDTTERRDEFDHAGLADYLRQRRGWLLSYNACPEVRRLYEGFRILEPCWVTGMGKEKGPREFLIVSD